MSETHDGPIAHLWYGSAGSRTRPHFDFYENFFMQVLGEKRWLLAPPAAFAEMCVATCFELLLDRVCLLGFLLDFCRFGPVC